MWPSSPFSGHIRIFRLCSSFHSTHAIAFTPGASLASSDYSSTNDLSLRLTTLFSATPKSTLPVISVDYTLTGPLDFAFTTVTACVFVPSPDWVSRKFVSTLHRNRLPHYAGARTTRVNSQFPRPDFHRFEMRRLPRAVIIKPYIFRR
jgi:hypothetical protein